MTDKRNMPPEPPKAPGDGDNQEPWLKPDDVPQPGLAPELQPNLLDLRNLKTSQTLTMIASIAGPVSLFIGGVFLSTVGLVCGFIGFKKLKVLSNKQTKVAAAAARLKRSSIIGMTVCAVALILNALSLYIMWPELMQMLETGNYANMAAGTGGGAGSTSTWG